MLASYFDCIFVHLRQKVRLRPELSPKFLSTLGPNPTRKAGPTYNSEIDIPFIRKEICSSPEKNLSNHNSDIQ